MAKRKGPKSRTAKARDSAERYCKKWFHRDQRCLAAGYFEEDKWRDCGNNGLLHDFEWCHIVGRGQGSLRFSPYNAVLLCPKHHDVMDKAGQMNQFIIHTFGNERLEQLAARQKEHYLDGCPNLVEEYEFWRDWYKNRPNDEGYMEWLGDGGKL